MKEKRIKSRDEKIASRTNAWFFKRFGVDERPMGDPCPSPNSPEKITLFAKGGDKI